MPTRRPIGDQLAAAAARQPVVVLVAPRGDATLELLRSLTAGTTWSAPRSLGEDALYAAARADQPRFARELPARSVLADADLIPGLAGLLCTTVGAGGAAPAGQLLLTVQRRDHVPSVVAAEAVVVLRPLTRSERLGRSRPCFTALFDAEPAAWTATPFTETQYFADLLEHGRTDGADGHLDALELAVQRAVLRRSGSWFERAALAAAVDAHPQDCARAVERLELSGRLRRLTNRPPADGGHHEPSHPDAVHGPAGSAGSGHQSAHHGAAHHLAGHHAAGHHAANHGVTDGGALGRLVATDGSAVARAFSLGGAAVSPDAVGGETRLALVRTAALSELLTQNEWLRRPCEAWTWHASRGNEQVDLLLTRADGRTLAVSVAATARLEDEPAQAAIASLQALRRRNPGLDLRLVVLYLGPVVLALGRELYAVPLSMLWSAMAPASGLGFNGFEDELADAFGHLSRLRGASGLDVEELARQREQARAFLDAELLAMVERTVARLGAYGLTLAFDAERDVDPGDPAVAGAAAAVLPATVTDVLAAARIRVDARPSDPRADAPSGGASAGWDAVVVAAGTRHGARWWVGQALDPTAKAEPAGADGATPDRRVIGRAGPLPGIDGADADRLLATLVAGLVDAAGQRAGR